MDKLQVVVSSHPSEKYAQPSNWGKLIFPQNSGWNFQTICRKKTPPRVFCIPVTHIFEGYTLQPPRVIPYNPLGFIPYNPENQPAKKNGEFLHPPNGQQLFEP